MQIRQVLASFQDHVFTSSFYQKHVRIANFYHFTIIPIRLSNNLCNTLQNKTKQEAQMSQKNHKMVNKSKSFLRSCSYMFSNQHMHFMYNFTLSSLLILKLFITS